MKDLTQGKVGSSILNFSIPMLVGSVFYQLYNIINSIIVGKYIGSVALAAVGASFPIMFIMSAMIGGLGMGGSILISQYFGSKNYKEIKITSDTLHVAVLVGSLIFSIIPFIFSEQIFRVLSIPEEVLPSAVKYFDIVILTSTIPMFTTQAISATMRGIGNSKTPMYFMGGSLILNILLDLLFVLAFKWGIEAVAWSTGISTTFAWITLWYYMNKRENKMIHFSLNYRKWMFNWQNFYKSLKIGLPTGIQQTFVGLGAMALLSIVSPYGTAALAAYSAAGRVDMFVSMPSMNLAAALASFVGQNLGAGRMDRIQKGFRSTLLYSAIFCLTLSMVVVFFGNDIMGLFVARGSEHAIEIIDIGNSYLVIVTSFYIVFTSMFVINGVARGAGATFIPMLITILSLWIVRVPLAYILSDISGITGIWWSIPIGWIVGFTGSLVYYKSGKWKRHRIQPVPLDNESTTPI